LHALLQGLKFRERNAGHRIDEHMVDEGFNNEIGVDLNTGFVFGGNVHNCGTWMDKMGSSTKAGNKGTPSSPRVRSHSSLIKLDTGIFQKDGSAVEIVGLSYNALSRLSDLHERGAYSYGAVERATKEGKLVKWSLKDWAQKIKANFESYFWVSKENPNCDPSLINRQNIYKDSVGSGKAWADYQLRCNFPIAVDVALDMFDVEHAWLALEVRPLCLRLLS